MEEENPQTLCVCVCMCFWDKSKLISNCLVFHELCCLFVRVYLVLSLPYLALMADIVLINEMK